MDGSIEVSAPNPGAMAWYELNDLGNAKRIADLAGGRLLWVEDHWMAFDGKRWSAEDGARLAQRLAHDMARHIPLEAEALDAQIDAARRERPDDVAMITERQAALFKHAVQSGNANKTTAALQQLKSELTATRDDFDRDPFCLNVANGTLRFVRHSPQTPGAGPPSGLASSAQSAAGGRSALPPGDAGRSGAGSVWGVKLFPHDPEDRISRIVEVEWQADAPAPLWAEHLETVLPNPDVRAFFQAAIGYAATGLTTEQSILLLQGRGGDGKSTTMDVVREVLGQYARTAQVESFLHGAARSGAEASPDMARLAGDTRLVCTSEPRIGAALDEGRIKQVTGGQPVSARELHGAPFEYVPKFLLVLECNRKPRISGDDDGIWRRVIVVEFPHQFKGTEIDKGVKGRLLAEGPGVLRWIVEGTLAWLEHGLVPPAVVTQAIDDYRRASNPFGEWFLERVDTRDHEARSRAQDLYDSYKRFCEDNGVTDREIMTSTAFGRALGDKQLRKMKGADGKVLRIGARLRDDGELAGAQAEAAQRSPAGDASVPTGGWDADWDGL